MWQRPANLAEISRMQRGRFMVVTIAPTRDEDSERHDANVSLQTSRP